MNRFSIDLLAKSAVASEATKAHLTQAQALIPDGVLEASNNLEMAQECARSGYNHLWMATLQAVGKWLESQNEDERLPAEYWQHLARAAAQMDFPQFIPYFLGKADRRKGCDWYDVVVAIVVLQRMLPEPLRAQHARAIESMTSYVSWLETLDPANPTLFQAPVQAGPLLVHLKDAPYFEDDETTQQINRGFTAMFDDVFSLVTDPALPDEMNDHAWPVIAMNTFTIDVRGMSSRAVVWWRA